MDMKYSAALILGFLLFASNALAQAPQITEYKYNPGDALHPFKLTSLALRPPLAITSVFVKGTYWVFNTDPIRRVFNIEYDPTINIDGDY
jgi:hypothetical protein